MTKRYNHMVSIAFTVISDEPDGSDLTPRMLRAALLKRLADLETTVHENEWLEACLPPLDTYEEEG